MPDRFLTDSRSGGRLIVIALIALVVFALVAVGILELRRPDHAGAGTRGSSASSPPTADDGVVPGGVASSGVGVLRLVRGSHTVHGISVGYPRTDSGAVSAAIEYATQISSTLDIDRAVTIGRTVTDSSYGDDSATFQKAPVQWRTALGLPTSGPVPAGASLALAVSAYQLRDVESDRRTVLLLGYVTTTTAAEGPVAHIALFPMLMVWSDRDWRLHQRPGDAPDYAELRLRPGSPEATAAGWLGFTR